MINKNSYDNVKNSKSYNIDNSTANSINNSNYSMSDTRSIDSIETESFDTNLSKVPDVKDVKFSPKEKYFYRSVNKYFKSTDFTEVEKMYGIIEKKKSHISLRLLDWFVTRYAKIKKISYKKKNQDDDFLNKFFVHISYKAQLRSYKKKYFDPFRRREKFLYPYDKRDPTKKLKTTIGQLNFFKWAFENDVISYVEKNYEKILKEMAKSNKKDKIRKQKNSTEKIKKTIIANNKDIKMKAQKRINNDNVEIVLSFDD